MHSTVEIQTYLQQVIDKEEKPISLLKLIQILIQEITKLIDSHVTNTDKEEHLKLHFTYDPNIFTRLSKGVSVITDTFYADEDVTCIEQNIITGLQETVSNIPEHIFKKVRSSGGETEAKNQPTALHKNRKPIFQLEFERIILLNLEGFSLFLDKCKISSKCYYFVGSLRFQYSSANALTFFKGLENLLHLYCPNIEALCNTLKIAYPAKSKTMEFLYYNQKSIYKIVEKSYNIASRNNFSTFYQTEDGEILTSEEEYLSWDAFEKLSKSKAFISTTEIKNVDEYLAQFM